MKKQGSSRKSQSQSQKAHHHETDRWKLDIEQANAMRRRSSASSGNHTASNNSSSERDVAGLGLRGLDEADVLREEGHLKHALDLYQSAIEVLIRYLRDPALQKRESYDPAAIEARVNLALSDAEQVKVLLQTNSQQPSEASTESPIRKTCFSKIKEYLLTNPAVQQQSTQRQNTNNNASSSVVKGRTVAKAKPSVRSPTSAAQSIRRPAPSAAAAASSKPVSNNNNTSPQSMASKEAEGLIETVKEDMYIPPSKMQAITWNDIAGLNQAKQSLQEAAIMPLLRPDLFTGLRKPQNILLYGSPGTGKTLLVKAVAHESQCNLFVCTASALTSKWHGEGEKLVRALFRVANESAPSIVFLDEIDALLSTRKSEGEHEASRRFKTEFMVQMDSISPNNNNAQVLVIACTNCPWDIDGAILRRFPKRIFVPLPDKAARKALLKSLLKTAGKHSMTSEQISDLVKRLKGFSGSDMQAIASEASFGPLRALGGMDAIRKVKAKDVRPISIKDFEDALKHATKSVSKDLLKRYDEWNQQQGA